MPDDVRSLLQFPLVPELPEVSRRLVEEPVDPQSYLRMPAVRKLVPVSAATLWKWAKNGKFPAPIKLSTNITAWRASDVLAWLEARRAEHEQPKN
jgi:predicted DNA-binding transcriptional regulator AlpA